MREGWNPIIHHCLKAIDLHNSLYFKTGEKWHVLKAAELRRYVTELKEWIKSQENSDHA